MRGRLLAIVGLAGCAAACSWTRFDDLEDDAPVVLLKKPDKMGQGFGVSLSTASIGKNVQLLVGGSSIVSGAAAYSLGLGQKPSLDAIDTGHCDPDGNPCALGRQTFGAATMLASDGADREMCFVIGVGSTPNTGFGLLTRCDDDTEFTLPVSDDVEQRVIVPAFNDGLHDPVAVSGDRALKPGVIAGAAVAQVAWYYAPDSHDPQALVPGPRKPTGAYGTSVAVALVDSSTRLLAVGEPDAGAVWLFRADDGAASPVLLGCIGGTPGFGRTLAAGPVNPGDTGEELVVADDSNVYVLDGKKLAGIAPGTIPTECSLGGLPPDTLYASFGCGSDGDTTGCGSSSFGAAIAVGDLDGDGDGEVVVGAPRMKTRGNARAGAVLVYDVEEPRRERISDFLIMSSAEPDDELGRTLATPFLEGHHVIAAGAPGNGKTALFYCSSLLPDDLAGKRCR